MIYASEVMSLLAAHPRRPFRMIEVRRYVEVTISAKDKQRREAVRIGVGRVMVSLIQCGVVRKVNTDKRTLYEWTAT